MSLDFWRQKDIFDPDKYGHVPIRIIGAGGIGSFLAIAVAKLGMQNVTVQDFDIVEKHNIPNQLFKIEDMGKMKVIAIKNIVKEFANLNIKVITDKFEDSLDNLEPASIIISAVDSMSVREKIFNAVVNNPMVDLFIDPRIGGYIIRVFTVPLTEPDAIELYKNEFYSDDDATDLPCTERAIIDVGFIVAGIVTGAIRNYLTSNIWKYEIIYDTRNVSLYTRGGSNGR